MFVREEVFIPGSYASVSVGSGLAQYCKNESDWLIAGGNTCPMIPGDAVKCMISCGGRERGLGTDHLTLWVGGGRGDGGGLGF